MYAIHRLKSRREIPDLPVYLNSPMAADATAIYRRHTDMHHMRKRIQDELHWDAHAPEHLETISLDFGV